MTPWGISFFYDIILMLSLFSLNKSYEKIYVLEYNVGALKWRSEHGGREENGGEKKGGET